jgi:hypothetical protein
MPTIMTTLDASYFKFANMALSCVGGVPRNLSRLYYTFTHVVKHEKPPIWAVFRVKYQVLSHYVLLVF